ncbi:hypothetical protein ACSRDE_19130, partial [Acinetobacter baumannii]|uniref:hypothetical protein n=1 Tax=Acinetobacter baumannii TaxID=470 RepID=UPI003EDAC8B8
IRAIKDQGFADGGYTGSGRKYEPAGIVHKGEVVWSQEDIKRWGGVGLVEKMRKSANPEAFLNIQNFIAERGLDVKTVCEHFGIDALIQIEAAKLTAVKQEIETLAKTGMTA